MTVYVYVAIPIKDDLYRIEVFEALDVQDEQQAADWVMRQLPSTHIFERATTQAPWQN